MRFERERDGMLPFMLWPALWWETRQQGMEIQTTRFTLGWAHYRAHAYWGRRQPISGAALSSAEFGLDEFASWMSAWSKRTVLKVSLEKWLQGSDWSALVRLGGAKNHYSRIVLGREFLAHDESLRVGRPLSADTELDVTLTLTRPNTNDAAGP